MKWYFSWWKSCISFYTINISSKVLLYIIKGLVILIYYLDTSTNFESFSFFWRSTGRSRASPPDFCWWAFKQAKLIQHMRFSNFRTHEIQHMSFSTIHNTLCQEVNAQNKTFSESKKNGHMDKQTRPLHTRSIYKTSITIQQLFQIG
jgi:hypothetical protein